MNRKQSLLALAAVFTALAAPAAAQFGTASEKFIEAVRDRDGGAANELLRSGQTSIINARDNKGQTPLMIAVARRDEDWSGFLLSHGPDLNARDNNGDTALILAARVGFTAIIPQLVKMKAKVDATNRMGETALIVAVQQRQTQAVKLLLEAGANPDKTDTAAGYSARDYAKRDNRSRDILKLIEAKPKA
jgi:ankyrin repeat protein